MPVNFERYVEPFAGSAALFFSLQPPKATLADANGQLVNTLKRVRDSHAVVLSHLKRMSRDRESYYKYRLEFNSLPGDDVRSAALFIYLNRNCFNGLWRTNKSGAFNVPYGGTEIGNYPPDDLFEKCAVALERADIVHQDFRKTLDSCGKGDFIFADPPYFTATERTFVEYGKRSFGASDLADLVGLLSDAADRGAVIAFTYSSAMEIENLPRSWQVQHFSVTRNVGGFKDSRRTHGELLYIGGVAA